MSYLFQKPVTNAEITAKTHLSLTHEILDYLWYFAKVFVVVLVAYLLIKDTVYRNFEVEGESMAPNYHSHDYVFVNKIAQKLGDIKRGDVVVFQEPDSVCPKISAKGSCFLIKRIIGLPGESVTLENGKVFITNTVYPKSIQLDESKYLAPSMNSYSDGSSDIRKTNYGVIPANTFFAMGDNRTNSTDSRFSQVGEITLSQIQGKEFYRQGSGFFSLPSYNITND